MGLVQPGRLVEGLGVERESLVLLAFTAQLLALLHEIRRAAGGGGLRGSGLLGEGERCEQE